MLTTHDTRLSLTQTNLFRGTTMSRPPSQGCRHHHHATADTQEQPHNKLTLQPNTKGRDTRLATTARHRPAGGGRPPQRTRTYYVCSNIEQARPDNSPHQKKRPKTRAPGSSWSAQKPQPSAQAPKGGSPARRESVASPRKRVLESFHARKMG